jgi:hypothetical protein
MTSDNIDVMWITRSLRKQARCESLEFTPEGEMEGARALMPSLPDYVLGEDDEWFIIWIKSQFILDPDQVAVLVGEKHAADLIRLIAEADAEADAEALASEEKAAAFYALQRAEERAEEGASAIRAADAARDALLARVYTGPEAGIHAEMVRMHNEHLAHGAFTSAKHVEIALRSFFTLDPR